MTIPQRPVNHSTEPTPIRPIRTSLRDAVRQRPPHATPVAAPATIPVVANRGMFPIDELGPGGYTDEQSEHESNLQEIERGFTPEELIRYMNLTSFMDRHDISGNEIRTIIRNRLRHR